MLLHFLYNNRGEKMLKESILNDLYAGKINPSERDMYQIKGYKELVEKLNRAENELSNTLSQEQNTLLDNYSESMRELKNFTCEHEFIYGFKLGGKIALTITSRKNELGN